MQNETPASLIDSGMISEIRTIGTEKIPKAATKITKEKLARGIQLNFSTPKFHDWSIVYTPSAIRPRAVAVFDTASNN